MNQFPALDSRLPCPPVLPVTLTGTFVRLEPVDPDRHAEDLFGAAGGHDEIWDYMFYGPFPDPAAFRRYLDAMVGLADPVYLAVVDLATGKAAGIVSYLRMAPEHGCVEIGHIWFAPHLQRTRATTEAEYLLARHVFGDLGYRRLEWKCNAQNDRSRRAAERLGFTFEGIFRQHMVIKGRNRDTAWYAMLDRDWPLLKEAFECWLDGANFSAGGTQKRSLSEVRDHCRTGFASRIGPSVTIRDVTASDEAAWRDLWRAYNAFYRETVPESVTAATWARILDPARPIGSVLAESNGRPVGFANFVVHEYTWSDRPACLMEDLFVEPESRGSGAGRALIAHLRERVRANGWSKLYWITQADNTTARRLYDTFTPPDGFIQYTIEAGPAD